MKSIFVSLFILCSSITYAREEILCERFAGTYSCESLINGKVDFKIKYNKTNPDLDLEFTSNSIYFDVKALANGNIWISHPPSYGPFGPNVTERISVDCTSKSGVPSGIYNKLHLHRTFIADQYGGQPEHVVSVYYFDIIHGNNKSDVGLSLLRYDNPESGSYSNHHYKCSYVP